MTRIQQFFQRYEEGANFFDVELVASQYPACFLGADPNGVQCIHNDAAFRKAIPERQAFFATLGFRHAKVLGIEETALDPRYTMAKVHWEMVFEKEPGSPKEFRFFITYFLFDPGPGPQVVFYISHEDEQKVMRDGGLL